MSNRQNKGRDPDKRRLKRQRQRASGYQQPPKHSASQDNHASSGKARKHARDGERLMERERNGIAQDQVRESQGGVLPEWRPDDPSLPELREATSADVVPELPVD